MSEWPPTAAESIRQAAWTTEQLEVGDLVFCAKSTGPLAELGKLADEPWRHVGIVDRDPDGEWAVLEAGNHFGWRKLEAFLDSYESYGVARLGVASECTAAALGWIRDRVHPDGGSFVYAWDDLVLAGLIGATRRGLFVRNGERVRAALSAAAQRCKQQLERRGRDSFTCSALVHLAYEASGSRCTIEYDRWRTATPAAASWPPRVESLDAVFDESSAEAPSAFGDLSVVELYAASMERERYIDPKMHMSVDQLGEVVKVLLAAVAGYATTPDRIEHPLDLVHDGRWVTPGDLWRSPTVVARGSLAT